MIRKIKVTEYLKPYKAMADGEQREYKSRVGEWLSDGGRLLIELTERPMAKSQNIMLSARWKKQEVRAFLEGARLLTALIGVADTWLPTQLYAKSAYRAVRQMVEVMVQVSGGGNSIAMQQTKKEVGSFVITEEQKRRIVEKYTKKAMRRLKGDPSAEKPESTVQSGKATGTGAQQTFNNEPLSMNQSGGVPPRPRHIDQYVHLLPETTQKKAAGYGELMRKFDVAREKLRIVMDDVHASDKEREGWAKEVSRLDIQIGNIRKELDREWEKVAASGRVVMDDLGMTHLVEPDGESSGSVSSTVAVGVQEGGGEVGTAQTAPATEEKADNQRRAALLRKWLIDTRYGNKDAEKRTKYQEKWREKYREMVRFGGMETVTEKVREAAKHYEIDIDALDKEVKPSA